MSQQKPQDEQALKAKLKKQWIAARNSEQSFENLWSKATGSFDEKLKFVSREMERRRQTKLGQVANARF